MRVATAPLYNILLTHAEHNVIIREDEDNGDMVVYCATCREAVLRQQKPEPKPERNGWST